MTLVLHYSARSDRGLVRQNNQDAVYAGPRLLALADGMGGHAAGEVASTLVISAMAPLDDDEPGDDLLGALRAATVEGNAAITRHIADQPDLDGMGTTLTAVLFAGNRLGLVHVGDSRAYLLREGALSQITRDDTFVQSLIDEGRITEEEALTHPQRSLLLRALTGHDIEPSLTVREARAGDRYLLCSDGLSGVVSEETIGEALTAIADPRECADRLIELALRSGGPDNITCIVADVVDIEYGEDAPIIGGAAGDSNGEAPLPDSAAARASVATLPRTETPKPPPPTEPQAQRDRRRTLRPALVTLVVLVLLIGGVLLARAWVMQQYYVDVQHGQVVIFQGVRGAVLGYPLQSVVQESGIRLDELQPDARNAVRGSSSYTDLPGAEQYRAAAEGERAATGLPHPGPGPGAGTAAGGNRARGGGSGGRPRARGASPGAGGAAITATPGRRACPHAGSRAGQDLPPGELMAPEHAPGAASSVSGPATPTARPSPSPEPAASRLSADPKQPTGRGVELVLLAFAAVLVTGALFLVQANTQQPVDNTLVFVGLAYLALFTAAHIAVRRFAPYSDPLILPAAALLNGLGLVMIYRIDLGRAARALQAGQPLPETFALRQIAWTAIALALFVAVLWLVRDHRVLARYGYTAGFVGLFLLALPGLLPGRHLGGQRREAVAARSASSPSSPASSPRCC